MEQMLAAYKCWANQLTLSDLSNIAPAELEKARNTNFGSLLATLDHIYVVDDIFRSHIEGREHGYRARKSDVLPRFEDLKTKIEVMDNWFLNWVGNLSESDLKKSVSFTFIGGGEGSMTHQEIILHLVNHATYHRGFISDMMYQIPTKPTANDLPVFLRDVWKRTS